MRVLILGKGGMLAHDMEAVFHDQDFVALGRSDLDITNQEQVFEKFMTVQPDVVINCAAFSDVDGAEKKEEEANRVNGYAVGILAKAAREIDATLVHFSTDYVFDGEKRSGYSEDDKPNPINAYGRSKLLGEKLLVDEMELLDELNSREGKYFLIRTSWLFGTHGSNFVDDMLELGRRRLQGRGRGGSAKAEVRVVSDQFGKPTYSRDLCAQVRWLFLTHDFPSGVYHVTNEGVTSRHDYAKKIFELAGLSLNVIACESAEFPRPAPRPRYSALNNNKLPALRAWEEALKEYISAKKS